MFLPRFSLSLRYAGLNALDLARPETGGRSLVLGASEVGALSLSAIALLLHSQRAPRTTGPFRSEIGAEVEGFLVRVWVLLVAMIAG